MASRGGSPPRRSPSSAKSTIMMPFFFTMPISRMMPMKAITVSSVPESCKRQQRAEPGRRQRRDDGERMRQALVQNAEHDIDRDQRRQQQQRLRAHRLLEGLHVAGEVGMDRVGNMHLRHRLLDAGGDVLDRGNWAGYCR